MVIFSPKRLIIQKFEYLNDFIKFLEIFNYSI